MDYNKTKILKDIRDLLQSLNCEIVLDINDGQLFNTLFQSEAKKETLLKWLLQHMYSLESCNNHSLDDLVSTFIPKAQYRSFIIGTMPIAEQYRKWRLIMSTLCQKHRRQNIADLTDYEKELISGGLLEKYSSMWTEKVIPSPKNLLSTPDVSERVVNELKIELDKIKESLSTAKAAETEKPINKKSVIEDNITTTFEEYKQSMKILNETFEQHFLPHLNKNRSSEEYAFRYESLDGEMLKNISKNAKILQNNIQMLDNALQGVDSIKNQE